MSGESNSALQQHKTDPTDLLVADAVALLMHALEFALVLERGLLDLGIVTLDGLLARSNLLLLQLQLQTQTPTTTAQVRLTAGDSARE